MVGVAEVHHLDVRTRIETFGDERGDNRHLRASWHPARGVVVLSVWQGRRCTATFRLPIDEAPRLISLLADGLADAAP
jgi:hypothetical protein